MQQNRVLLMSDDSQRLRSLQLALTAGFVIERVSRAVAAPDLAAFLPDCLVTELTDDFFPLLEHLRNNGLNCGFVLLVSQSQPTADVVRAIREGALVLFEPIDGQVLRALVAHAVEMSRLRAITELHAKRLQRELTLAGTMQHAMLPPPSGRLGSITISYEYCPCSALSGDFVDYAQADDGRVSIIIADAVGHGVAAAMLTLLIRSAFRSASGSGYDPHQVVLNTFLALQPSGYTNLATLLCIRIDPKKRALEFVNAGHPSAFVFEKGKVIARLDPTGPLVCPAIAERVWERITLPLPSNGGILMYTDGALEAASEHGLFGETRLIDAISSHRGGGPPLLQSILKSLLAFGPDRKLKDDVTLLCAIVGVPGLA